LASERRSPPARRESVLKSVERLEPELLKFARQLVRARSVTGWEGEAQGLVTDKLRGLGSVVDVWKPRRSDFRGYEGFVSEEKNVGERPNVVGRFPGSSSKKTLAFNGHIDVVPEGDPKSWRHPPFGGSVSAGKLYGRGSCDMKAGLAAAVVAVQSLMDSGVKIENDILIESVIGEESGGMGTLATILRGYVPDAAIIAEPTDLRLNIVQAGCLMFRLRVKGKAAHGASRYMGVSAIEKFQPVLNALLGLEKRRMKMKQVPVFRGVPNPVTLSVGTLQAGNWDSTVPEGLVAEGRYGVWPGETLDDARSMFEEAVSSASSQDDWLRSNPPKIDWFGPQWEPAELSPRHWLTKMMEEAVRASLGFRPKLSGITGGTDMRLFTAVAHRPAVIFGPGDDATAHFSDEHVSVKDIVRACKVYSMAALSWNE
jgi:acetylornithine deacetylase